MARMRSGFPLALKGQIVGLLGGSFDPAHEGHVHLTREALKRLGLDRVWWLVTPGNPLKARGPAPLGRRLGQARALVDDPRVDVTDIETRLGTRHTAETIAALQARYPGVRFVWLMGADNLAQFHRWENWRGILARVPVAVLARPGQRIAARTSPMATIYRPYLLSPARAYGIGHRAPPVWTFLNIPMNASSSSAIRATGGWS